MVPAVTLGTSLSFRQLAAPERDFGRVRLWGTIGWMCPGFLLAMWFENPPWLCALHEWLRGEPTVSELADSLRLAAMLAFALSLYALTLPHTPPFRKDAAVVPLRRWFSALDAPLRALRLCRRGSFAVYCLCSWGLYVTISFNAQITPFLFEQLGFGPAAISRLLPIAQGTEFLTLAFLPMFLLRFSLRGTMFLGLAAWAAAMSILSLGQPSWLVIGSLGLNGICVCCFMVVGQLYVNGQASADIRASAQGLLTFINGLGLLVGHLLVGWLRWYAEGELRTAFVTAAALAAALVVIFFVGFSSAAASAH
jgi:hypothetical protein